MRKNSRERLVERNKKNSPQTSTDLDGLAKLLLGGDFNPTQKRFMYEPDRIKAYKGPAGCAKTSTLAAAGLLRALLQPGSKGFVSRNDYNDLMNTTMHRMTEMIGRLPKGVLIDRDKSPPMRWWIQPAVPGGEPSEITFMGLKDDVVGVEANWWMVDEANEVLEQRIHQINARMRAQGEDYMIGLAFNPPDKHHWLYTACTGKDFQDRPVPGKPAWMKLYEPQAKENVRNLPDRYYEILAETMPEDQKQRYVDGEWGSDFGGQPVYREFKYGLHVRDGLSFDPQSPIYRCWDFGYSRPCCLWTQVDWEGRWLILKEFLGSNIEATAFAKRIVQMTKTFFPGARQIADFGDPAVVQKKDTGQTLAELYKEGITMQYQISTIEKGLKIGRQKLNTLIDGEPAVQFDREGCPILIAGMRGGYHLDDKGEKPVKDGYYDHECDAWRYGLINIWGGAFSTRNSDTLPASVAYDGSNNYPESVASTGEE